MLDTLGTVVYLTSLVCLIVICMLAKYNKAKRMEQDILDEIESEEKIASQIHNTITDCLAKAMYNSKSPNEIISTLATHADWTRILEEWLKYKDMIEYNEEPIVDPVLLDMKNEFIALTERFEGAVKYISSDEFKEVSDTDKKFFRKQLYGMFIYHVQLLRRCHRYGILVEKDTKENENE